MGDGAEENFSRQMALISKARRVSTYLSHLPFAALGRVAPNCLAICSFDNLAP
jgi:hypothetical protein